MATSVCVSDLIQIDQMSIRIESSRNITNVSAIDPKVRLQMATSVCVSDFKLIKCQLNLKFKKYNKRVTCIYPRVRLQMATSICICSYCSYILVSVLRVKIDFIENTGRTFFTLL